MKDQKELVRNGYPAPTLPYLAYVPHDGNPSNPERILKCLLCNKWVQDEISHSGPAGSKDHRRYVSYYGPGDPWYQENVFKERLKWHPNSIIAPSVSTRVNVPQPPGTAPTGPLRALLNVAHVPPPYMNSVPPVPSMALALSADEDEIEC